MQRIDLTGNLLWNDDLAITSEGGIALSTNVFAAQDNNEGIIISWPDDRNYENFDRSYVQAVDKHGNLRFPESGFLLDDTPAYTSFYPMCSVDSNNNIYAVWFRVDAQYQINGSVRAQKFVGSNNVWTADGSAVTEVSDQITPSFSSGVIHDKLYIALKRARFGNYDDTDLTAVLLDENSNNTWGEEAILSSVASTKSHLTDTGWNNYMIVLAWQGNRNNQNNIFMQNLNYNGTIGNQGPDASISSSDISYQPSNPQPGDTVTITARVYNIGHEAIESGSADFYYSLIPDIDMQLIESVDFGTILPAEYIDIIIDWITTPDFEPVIYTITVNIRDVIPEETNLDNNTASIDIELPVELGYFRALGFGNTVKINWMTISETDNLGFNIYRLSAVPISQFLSPYPVRINESLIPGQGTSSSPEYYSFTDYVNNGSNFIYLLECISTSGIVTDEYRTELRWIFQAEKP